LHATLDRLPFMRRQGMSVGDFVPHLNPAPVPADR
jgi:hypothetical protein